MKKKFWLVLCIITCIFAFNACSSSDTSSGKSSAFDENTLKSITENYLQSWNETEFADYLNDDAQGLDENTRAKFTEWMELKEKVGTFDSITKTTVNKDKESATIMLTAKYSKGSINFSVSFDKESTVLNIQAERKVPLIETMERALLNTVMAILIVFSVLLFVSIIIYFLKFIPIILDGFMKKDTVRTEATKAVDQVITSISEKENSELMNDQELVAVITAAIMASMGSDASNEGLIVRSIKRKSTNQWNKA